METRPGSGETWPINQSASHVGALSGWGLWKRVSPSGPLPAFGELKVSARLARAFFSHSWPAEGVWDPRLSLLKFSEFCFTENGGISF